jgi:hypothetical protein
MQLQFSEVELLKLKVSWLAWRNIESARFLKEFRELWNADVREAEALIEKAGLHIRIEEIGKLGITVQPSVSFAFSPIAKGYFVNVWSLFFCSQKADSSAFFRPTFLLANELVHEYTHYRFWLDHGMLEKSSDEKEQFDKSYGLENERVALDAGLSFFKKITPLLPEFVNIKLLRVKSWKRKGKPNCEGLEAQMPTNENIIQNIACIEKALKELSSKQNYDGTMVSHATETHSALSEVLKMDVSANRWPIVEMKI